MKHQYHETIKNFVREEIITAVAKQKLTNEQAADKLGLSSRNYSRIKAGQNSCSTETFIAYTVNICDDQISLLQRMSDIVRQAESTL